MEASSFELGQFVPQVSSVRRELNNCHMGVVGVLVERLDPILLEGPLAYH